MKLDSPTGIICNFLTNTNYEDIPQDVIRKAKMFLLDALGCGLAGFRTEPARITSSIAKSLAGERVASLIGDGTKVSSPAAAFANAVAINALDYDDTADIPNGMGHIGSTVVSTCLAVGEEMAVDGKKVLSALVLGYEIAQRIGMSMQPSPDRWNEVWATGTWQTFGAVASASKLMDLDFVRTLNAFGLAGSGAPVPAFWKSYENPRPLSWVKDQIQWAALAGVLGAQMSRIGFEGNRRVLDGAKGFWKIAGSDKCDFDLMTRDLGDDYRFIVTAIKPYPCCRTIHTSLDCIDSILKGHSVDVLQIEEVSITTGASFAELLNVQDVHNMIDAEFSIPYATSMVLLGVPKGPEWYSEQNLRSPTVRQIMKRVKLRPAGTRISRNGNEDAFYASSNVQVKLKSGKVFTKLLHHPKGSPYDPLREQEIKQKFGALASYALGPDDTKKVVSLVEEMERVDDINTLMGHLISWKKN